MKDIKMPIPVAVAFLVALIGVQGWILREIVSLKVSVARIEIRVDQRLAADPSAHISTLVDAIQFPSRPVTQPQRGAEALISRQP